MKDRSAKIGAIEYSLELPSGWLYASDEERQRYEQEIRQKMERKWTESPYVEEIFGFLETIAGSAVRSGRASASDGYDMVGNRGAFSAGCHLSESTPIGYLNPRASRTQEPIGYKACGCQEWELEGGIRERWDIRWHKMPEDRLPRVRRQSLNGLIDYIDVPECYTNIATTIFVTDQANMLDVLEIVGEIDPPRCEDDEVFLVVTPKFISKHPELSDIICHAKAAGEVIDVRDWIREGGFVEARDERGCRQWKWTGSVPYDIAEELLASRMDYIARCASPSLIGVFGRGVRFNGKDALTDASIIARAMTLRPDAYRFPALSSGRKVTMKGKWNKLARAFDFSPGSYQPPFDELAEEVSMLEDVARIWAWAAEGETRPPTLLEGSAHVMEPPEFIAEVSRIADELGLASSIETLYSGVPVEDIIA